MTYAYDAANRLTSVTDWNLATVSYAYDDAGRMTAKTLPAGTGVVSSYAYDAADRLTGIAHVKDGQTTLASVSYTLDAVGNRTQRVDEQGTHSYSYDGLYRLTSVTYPGPSSTSYSFDPFGNRTSMTNSAGTTTYAYDDAGRLTEVQPPSPAPAIGYDWDDNGNLVERGSDTFAWDYEDRMTSATVNGTTSTFTYRGDGLRDSRTTGGNTTTFTWDINAGLPVVLDDGNRYLYGAGLEAMLTATASYYYLADGLGSTMAMVDSAGAIQKSYTYDVYGSPTATGALPNEYDFAAQQTDPGTGLQYLRARYMDPDTGRFLSRDPLAAFPIWESAPFGYADAAPTTSVDPMGTIAGPVCRRDERWRGDDDIPGCRPPESGGAGPSTVDGDPFGYLRKPAATARDIEAWFVVSSNKTLNGEYVHRWLRNCALDEECRGSVDKLLEAKQVYALEIGSMLAGLPEAAIIVAILPIVWDAYKHVYDRPNLRAKMGD